MKETLVNWLDQQPRIQGVLAAGIRFADQTASSRAQAIGFPVVALENAWRCVADTFQVLNLQRMQVHRFRWVYEQAYLYCARRGDGVILAVFTTRVPGEVDEARLEQFINDFLTLRSASA